MKKLIKELKLLILSSKDIEINNKIEQLIIDYIELPDQMIIKSSEGKLLMLNCNDLLRMELKEKIIEGFETWEVIGTGAVIPTSI